MRHIFENFRMRMRENYSHMEESVEIDQRISELVDEYYAHLSDKERNLKKVEFNTKLNKNINQHGTWIRKSIIHAMKGRMERDMRSAARTPEEVEADKERSHKSITKAGQRAREMSKKYGRRWNR